MTTTTMSATLPGTSLTLPALAPQLAANWIRLCPLADLEVERGRAALVGGEQVALFLLADGDIRAVDNHDPYSGANVISRGIVGSRGGRPTVASPMYKQIFDLRSGTCVDTRGKEFRRLRVWPVRSVDGDLHLLQGGAR
ncbi:nitrite reductase small subunit NirD [Brachybacterium sp.]|uniref:nitrite reductase small subunit NirD n=1 Tax=Brachybacterium sp. TaxID=1891286 RepID=UPI003F8F415A